MKLHKALSKREKTLLAVLGLILVAAAYLMLVHFPTVNHLEEIEAESLALQDELTVMTTMQQKQNQMLSELDRLEEEGPLANIPDYDNLESVMNFLNAVLAGAEDYSLSFQGITSDEGSSLVSRSMSMVVTLPSYIEAKALVLKLEHSPYRCTLNDLSILPGSSDSQAHASIIGGPVTMSAQLTFYELKK